MNTHESRYIRVARLAHLITKSSLPTYSHQKSPHTYQWPQLAACVLLMFYLRLSYRDMEEWLLASDRVCQTLGLTQVPDHSTLCRAFHKLRGMRLRAMERQLLVKLQVQEDRIASDSTGLRLDQASSYYQLRSGKVRREWIKGAYAVGTSSQYIVASRHGTGRTPDGDLLNGLRRDARRCTAGPYVMVADAGFDGSSVWEGDVIPPIRRHGTLIAPERIARAELVSQSRLDGVYGQRWKAETVFSVLKRKFGDAVRSRTRRAQRAEPILLGLIYNLHVC
jgi:hypothetical protein